MQHSVVLHYNYSVYSFTIPLFSYKTYKNWFTGNPFLSQLLLKSAHAGNDKI